jgi:hypothetical protein
MVHTEGWDCQISEETGSEQVETACMRGEQGISFGTST